MTCNAKLSKRLWVIIAAALIVPIAACGGQGTGSNQDPLTRWNEQKERLLAEASEKTPEELVLQLESQDAMERVAAYITLGDLEPQVAMPLLVKYRDGDHYHVWDAYRELIRKWGSDAMPVLMGMLESSPLTDYEVNPEAFDRGWAAVEGLQILGPEAARAVPFLVAALQTPVDAPVLNPDPCSALEAIGDRSDGVIEALLLALDDESTTRLPESACYALGELASPGDEEVIQRLIDFVYRWESHPRIILWDRVIAGRCALYKLGHERAVNYEVIREKAVGNGGTTDSYSSSAWKALARIGDDRAVELLGNIVLQSEHLALSSACRELASVGPRSDVIRFLTQGVARPASPAGALGFRIETAYWCAYYLGKFGSDATDALPPLLNLYTKMREEAWYERDQILLSGVEEAILRIHEGV